MRKHKISHHLLVASCDPENVVKLNFILWAETNWRVFEEKIIFCLNFLTKGLELDDSPAAKTLEKLWNIQALPPVFPGSSLDLKMLLTTGWSWYWMIKEWSATLTFPAAICSAIVVVHQPGGIFQNWYQHFPHSIWCAMARLIPAYIFFLIWATGLNW